MKLAPVLGPDGLPYFSAGGHHAWKTFEHKGYTVSLEWVGDGSRKSFPCMVIWKTKNVFVPGESAGMWTIGRRAITEFVGFTKDDKCTGGASEHCEREARQALPILGQDVNDKNALNALIDTVVRFAPDLVLMPPTPRGIRQEMAGDPFWDVLAINKNTGKTLSEASV